jgi:hypothetical protein
MSAAKTGSVRTATTNETVNRLSTLVAFMTYLLYSQKEDRKLRKMGVSIPFCKKGLD